MRKTLIAAAALTAAMLLAVTSSAAGGAKAPDNAGTIAFLRGDTVTNHLYVIGADGSGLQRVTPPATPVFDAAYAWSPNARLIAFIDARRNSLWVIRPDGSGLRRLLSGSKHASVSLSWSPDGRRIAVVSPGRYERIASGGWECEGMSIYVVPVHGSRPRALRRADAGCGVAWSPRGNEIAYDLAAGGIGIIHPDGTGLRQVSPFGAGPHWSADGKLLAFNVALPLGRVWARCRYCAFAVVKANGKNFHVVTTHAYTEYGEVWSPHGRQILYGAGQGGINLTDAHGRHDRRVTNDSPPQTLWPALAWSPDGSSIVYVSARGGLYEVGVNGGGEVQLTIPDDQPLAPSWVAHSSMRRTLSHIVAVSALLRER